MSSKIYIKYKIGISELFERTCLNSNVDVKKLFYTFSDFKEGNPTFINVYSEKGIRINLFKKNYGGLWYSEYFEKLDEVAVMVLEAIQERDGK